MNATPLPPAPLGAGLTLDELRAINIPALWSGLSPEMQAAIGEALVAERLANLVSRTPTNPVADQAEAERLNFEAHNAARDAVEHALPGFAW